MEKMCTGSRIFRFFFKS